MYPLKIIVMNTLNNSMKKYNKPNHLKHMVSASPPKRLHMEQPWGYSKKLDRLYHDKEAVQKQFKARKTLFRSRH